MDSMDVKGIAWVGNIYQKFEAMCLEVEEAMCQETAKYVENQVQTMGASMKRFCSDVMQDLLPPSSKDLSKVASAELLLNPYLEFGIHMKPVSNFKEDVKDPVYVKGKKGISEEKSNSSNDAWEDWSAASFNWEMSDKDEANEGIECELRGGQEGQICNLAGDAPSATNTVLTKSSEKGRKRSRCISSSNIIRAERTATCESSGLVSQMVSQATSITSIGQQSIDGDASLSDGNSSRVSLSQTGSDVSVNTECGQSVGDEVFLSHTGSSADHDPDLRQENKTTLQTTEPIGDEFESGFEETCVLVDGNDYRPINHKQETRRSYKKKLQGAFTLKKKSSRKQEYTQLAAQYNNLNSTENKKPDKLTTRDSLESEWEIL